MEIIEEGIAVGEVKGLIEGERRIILRQASAKFGPPDGRTLSILNAITDPNEFDRLGDEILTATSWDQLLGH